MIDLVLIESGFVIFGWVVYIWNSYRTSKIGSKKNKTSPNVINVKEITLLIETLIWSFYPLWISFIQLCIQLTIPQDMVIYIAILMQNAVMSSFIVVISMSFLVGILLPLRITGRFLGITIDYFDRKIVGTITSSSDYETLKDGVTEIWIRSEIYGNEKSLAILSRIMSEDDIQKITNDTISALEQKKEEFDASSTKTTIASYSIFLSVVIALSILITLL